MSALAAVAEVGRTRASAVLSALADLGVVSRREVGPTVLVRPERGNAAGHIVARLAGLRGQVIEELPELAGRLDPHPLSISLFGGLGRHVHMLAAVQARMSSRRSFVRRPSL